MPYVERSYTFKCPECKKLYVYDQPGEPLCDGPGATRQHEPKVMERQSVTDKDLGTKQVSEAEAKLRAEGTLLTPHAIQTLKLRVKGKLWRPKEQDDE